MIGYLKNPRTFVTEALVYVSSYDLVLGSVYDNVSKVTVDGEYSFDIEKHFLILDDYIGIIKTVVPSAGQTQLALDDIDTLWSRDLVYVENSPLTIEKFIADTIDSSFIQLADDMFNYPYCSVSFSAQTGFIKPDVENGLWNLKSYISKVRRMKNVFVSYSISGDTLAVRVEQRTPNKHIIDFAASDSLITNETYSSTKVSKITVNGVNDYYLFDDGTFDTDPDAGTRVDGDWEMISVSESQDELDAVKNEFAKNSESHIIEFATKLPVQFYDTIVVRSKGRVTSSYISTLRKTSASDLLQVKTGDLIDTIPEYLTNINAKVETINKNIDALLNGQGEVDGDFAATGDIYEGGVKLSDKYGQATAPVCLADESYISGNTSKTIPMGTYSFFILDIKSRDSRRSIFLPAAMIKTTAQSYWVEQLNDGASSPALCRMSISRTGSNLNITRNGSEGVTVSVYAW